MRLIDADAAADEIMRETENHSDDLNMVGIALMVGIAKMLRDENNFPTIEAEPVRHGRWENPTESKPRMFEHYGHTFTERQCSECRLWSIQVAGSITYKYCPHCSVKMRGDEDATERTD